MKDLSCHADETGPFFSLTALAVLLVLLHAPTLVFADELPPHMLEMEAALSHQMIMIGESQEIYATIDLEALHAEVDERPPMNVALVIDRSGSMRGDRIEQARRASLHVVDSLSDQDRLAVITYGSDHTVNVDSRLVTDENANKMRRSIRNIQATGATNLSAGYEAGIEIVGQHHDPDAINRIILLSDGHANRGITGPDQLRSLSRQAFDDGISTSTIGFGLNYNAQLMTGMAVEGSGNYYFVNDGDDLGALVAREMSGLSATVANRIEVVIDPGPDVEIEEVFGFSHRFRDGKTVVSLSELGALQSRSIVVRLRAVPREMETMDVITVRTNYRDAINDRFRYRRQVLRAGITEDSAVVDRNVDRDVLTRVEEVRLAQAMDEAMEAYAANDREEARAVLDRERRRSRKVQDDYDLDDDKLDDLSASFDRASQTVESEPASSSGGSLMLMESSADSFERKQSR